MQEQMGQIENRKIFSFKATIGIITLKSINGLYTPIKGRDCLSEWKKKNSDPVYVAYNKSSLKIN